LYQLLLFLFDIGNQWCIILPFEQSKPEKNLGVCMFLLKHVSHFLSLLQTTISHFYHCFRQRYPLFFILLRRDLDPVLKRHILRLKFRNLFHQFQIFLLKCNNIILNFKVTRLEFVMYRRRGVGINRSLRCCLNNFLFTMFVRGEDLPQLNK